MTEHRSPIPARVYNAAVGGHVCGPDDIDFGQKVVHLIKYDRGGNEVSFESQVTQANKIYVIHDDFTLSSNVNIPTNCVLEFDGGSVSGNKTITGSNTGIQAGLVKIFNTDVTLEGSWNISEAYPEWFGAKGDGVTDDTEALCKVVYVSKIIKFNSKGNYIFTPNYQDNKRINLTNHIIYGNGCTFTVNGASDEVDLFYVDETQELLTNGANVELYDMTIVGVGSYEVAPSQSWMGSGYTSSNVVGFHCIGKSNLIAKNIIFKNLLFGIRSGENSLLTGDSSLIVENCTWDIDCILPMLAQRYTYVNIKDCKVSCKTNTSSFIHHFYLSYLKGTAHINNCKFVGGTGHGLTLTSCEKEIFVSGCYFNTNNYCICCDFDEDKILFDNCYLQSSAAPIYVQGGTHIILTSCIVKNISTFIAANAIHIANGATVEMIGCELQSIVLCNQIDNYKSIIRIYNSVLRLTSDANSIKVTTPNTNDSEIIITHSTINTSLAPNGVLAEITNSIVCKIIDCIINRDELGNFLFAPDANVLDKLYFNNCLAYNVSAIFAGWVTPKGNVTGSQIIQNE